MKITEEFLNRNPDIIFVYGDNDLHVGKGGAAVLREHPQARGFITKRRPSMDDDAFYRPDNYTDKLDREIKRLEEFADANRDKLILVSRVGAGLANKYDIWEMIKPKLRILTTTCDNIVLLN